MNSLIYCISPNTHINSIFYNNPIKEIKIEKIFLQYNNYIVLDTFEVISSLLRIEY